MAKNKDEQRLQKIREQRVYLTTLIIVLIIAVFGGFYVVYKGAQKNGISWEDIEEQHEEEFKEELPKGHIGGEELLIEEDYIKQVSVGDFKEKKDRGEEFYAYFYTKYCPYCSDIGSLVPDTYEKEGVDYVVVDVNRNIEFQEEENVEGVPMLVKYKDGKQVDYILGVESEQDVIEFIRSVEGDNKEN